MKRLLLTLMACAALVLSVEPVAAHGGHASSAKSSKKSSVPGSKDGEYVGGNGSSHKGGHYKNSKTDDHERNRKAGVPK
jgi:hypothetical protein